MLWCQFYLAFNNTIQLKMNATFKLFNQHQMTAGSFLEDFKRWFKMWGHIPRSVGGFVDFSCVCVFA